jgi:hypothetical protein
VAVHFLVPAFEWPLRVSRVIEHCGEPLLVAVAGAAFLSEASGVGIDALMAAVAGLRQWILQSTAAMAVGAIEARVSALQCEARLLSMIELGRFPARGGVAVGAFRPALSTMNIIRCMA